MDDGQRRTLPSQLRGPGRLRVCRTATGRPLCAAAGWCRCRHCVPVATTGPATTGSATTGSATTLAPVELVAALPGVTATGVVVESTLVTADGRTRVYRTYVPSALPDGPVPLLLAFHGGTGWGRQFERNSGFDELAESNGFLVVYPDGVGSGADETTNRTWNGGECCGAAARNNVDDVAFVSQLLDTLAVEYDIDSTRVFIAGHSNGGILSYRLACELSDRIVAVGLQAGTIGIQNCAPSSPITAAHPRRGGQERADRRRRGPRQPGRCQLHLTTGSSADVRNFERVQLRARSGGRRRQRRPHHLHVGGL